jgi:hypothetical protein
MRPVEPLLRNAGLIIKRLASTVVLARMNKFKVEKERETVEKEKNAT